MFSYPNMLREFKTINGRVSDENGYLSDVTVISRGNNTHVLIELDEDIREKILQKLSRM